MNGFQGRQPQCVVWMQQSGCAPSSLVAVIRLFNNSDLHRLDSSPFDNDNNNKL